RLARNGYHVYASVRRHGDGEALVAEAEGEITPLVFDVTDDEARLRAVDQIRQSTGPQGLSALINNAGAFNGGPLAELATEDWDHVMNTNLRGPFLCTRAALQIMQRQGGGRIINIGSISAQRVRPHSAPYSTSKHGLWGLTQVTALEGRDHGITCGCLHPGNILTERRDASDAVADQEPMIGVDDIAEVALLMASLPAHVEMLSSIVLPHQQLYVGRG
ncbi:MAG TPA: SDR family oxidoreductase, partial [Planctomycetaceae bacterium]|nr:SDR family oxidoreductase [Planctomycetaceae bacterium]